MCCSLLIQTLAILAFYLRIFDHNIQKNVPFFPGTTHHFCQHYDANGNHHAWYFSACHSINEVLYLHFSLLSDGIVSFHLRTVQPGEQSDANENVQANYYTGSSSINEAPYLHSSVVSHSTVSFDTSSAQSRFLLAPTLIFAVKYCFSECGDCSIEKSTNITGSSKPHSTFFASIMLCDSKVRASMKCYDSCASMKYYHYVPTPIHNHLELGVHYTDHRFPNYCFLYNVNCSDTALFPPYKWNFIHSYNGQISTSFVNEYCRSLQTAVHLGYLPAKIYVDIALLKCKLCRSFYSQHDYLAILVKARSQFIGLLRHIVYLHLLACFTMYYTWLCIISGYMWKYFAKHSSLSQSVFSSLGKTSENLFLIRSTKLGGYAKPQIPFSAFEDYILPIENTGKYDSNHSFVFVATVSEVDEIQFPPKNHLYAKIPPKDLSKLLTLNDARSLVRQHGLSKYRPSLNEILHYIEVHHCIDCTPTIAVILFQPSRRSKNNTLKKQQYKDKKKIDIKQKVHVIQKDPFDHSNVEFPPRPLDNDLENTILREACKKMDHSSIEESGCAVCGQLTPLMNLSPLKHIQKQLSILEVPGVARKERLNSDVPVEDVKGPILDTTLSRVCNNCRGSIRKGILPRYAMAQGLWLGSVPPVLQNLRFMERLLIARVRYSCCFIRISTGRTKMKANVIAFESPTPKLYTYLPPPREDMDEVGAVLFTGPSKPTTEDFKRTPLLVRPKEMKLALQWLILNNPEYDDVKISDENLNSYETDFPPCSVEYLFADNNKIPEGTSVFDLEDEDGTEEGECPFIVHGITGEEINGYTVQQLKAKAWLHLNTGGKVLAVGHDKDCQSLWKNPHLYPRMFPHLFPYGTGALGSSDLSEAEHMKYLLMFHDKRFQTDAHFPFVAFSHKQIKRTTNAAWLQTEKKSFHEVAERLLNIDLEVVNYIAEKLALNEPFKPTTEEEKTCYKIINDIDQVAGYVEGSTTTKKHMRNEIWSLIAHRGAPSWYITISPADEKHPISLYYSGTHETFNPVILNYNQRLAQTAKNPVAAARFFHFMVEIFLTDVLGCGSKHRGLYGDHAAHYGTVEQQGRLTLHLHLLLWLKGNVTPQEMRDRVLDPNSDWMKKLVYYLESVHCGEYINGTQHQVNQEISKAALHTSYKNPTETMPIKPPCICKVHSTDLQADVCKSCKTYYEWQQYFNFTVDDLISKSNIHTCDRNIKRDGSLKLNSLSRGCKDNKWNKCKARFPRPLFKQTTIDKETGAISMRKAEPWLNMFTRPLTYLLRCNTDVTNLSSGTAIKATVLYVSDYITKASLKTHVVFSCISSIFSKNSDLINGSTSTHEKARMIMTKIVNLLTTKMELGGPMICLYLLGNPDHYTDHKFTSLYWRDFVTEARQYWHVNDVHGETQKVTIMKKHGRVVGMSPVNDYVYRNSLLNDMSLYEWVRCSERITLSNALSKIKGQNGTVSDNENETSDANNNSITSMGSNVHNSEEPTITLRKSCHRFQPEHPLHDTHVTYIKKPSEFDVVNFIGGTLPRPDCGDREYYCSAMLTLFKPWRSGKDLKNIGYSWEKAFEDHQFTCRELQLMKNFNIRYECLDARDDYRAQLKADAKINSSWDRDWLDDNEPTSDDFVFTNQKSSVSDVDGILNPGISNAFKKHMDQVRNIKAMLTNTGWLDPVSLPITDTSPDANTLSPPTLYRSGAEWKDVIAKIKNELKAKKKCSISDNNQSQLPPHFHNSGEIQIVDKSYLQKSFIGSHGHQRLVASCSQHHNLNEEQERAFNIVTNHASSPLRDQLKMYVGGMGGTGKSQVIKALSAFFALRNETHRFLVLAPTGNAASLLGGSTYHSILSISPQGISDKSLPQVRENLQGVDYIFIDEVSMISAHDMYLISARLAKASGNEDIEFGGMNLIFAGDFAQLPPPLGSPLYSWKIGLSGNSIYKQEECIGKSIWHGITTVVILRKNMRQNTMSAEDSKFRTTLENMRFKKCTTADIAFLRSRITGNVPGATSVCDPLFRNVPIITALNIHKDEINRMGCERFAIENKSKLVHFYSEDVSRTSSDHVNNEKKTYKNVLPLNVMNDDIQKLLWSLGHSSSDSHIPSKLSLCIGMPVMIRKNLATELCITKGQEGTVYGWQTKKGSRGQLMLDVLFVKLINLPAGRIIEIDGLPADVVPLYTTSNSMQITLPNGSAINIIREQVEILPNFAMTDFASQGKTRPYNVVDVNNCKDYHGIYTALSRSSTASGTLLIQGFSPKKITDNMNLDVRVEFRELEILDEITKLQCENKLHPSVNGRYRKDLIKAFRMWKGENYIPKQVPAAIKWSPKDPWVDNNQWDTTDWHIVSKQKMNNINEQTKTVKSPIDSEPSASVLTPSETLPYASQSSTVADNDDLFHSSQSSSTTLLDINMNGKRELVNTPGSSPQHSPVKNKKTHIYSFLKVGPTWQNNSCAYDSVLTVFYAIWLSDPEKWIGLFTENSGSLLNHLGNNLERYNNGEMTLNDMCDDLRRDLHREQPAQFEWGNFASAGGIIEILLRHSKVIFTGRYVCPDDIAHMSNRVSLTLCNSLLDSMETYSCISDWISLHFHSTRHKCTYCSSNLHLKYDTNILPPILAFQFSQTDLGGEIPYIESSFVCIDSSGGKANYRLYGVIYFGDSHYTARIIDENGKVWYYDGIANEGKFSYNGDLSYDNIHLNKRGQKTAALAVYAISP